MAKVLDGNRDGERQQDEKPGQKCTEATDHPTPFANTPSGNTRTADLFGGLVGYRAPSYHGFPGF